MVSKTSIKLAPDSPLVHLGLVERVKQSLFPAGTKSLALPSSLAQRSIRFNASIAEFLLVIRLKARSQRKVQAAEILDRASHIVLVTCKDWFCAGDGKSSGGRKPL